MAQAQYETKNEVLELTSEDNETLDVLVKENEAQVNEETLKEAYQFLLENEPSKKAEIEAAGIQNTLIMPGTMSNSMSVTLTRSDLQRWDGTLARPPPETISARGRGTFLHTAIFAPGARGGVVYTGRRSDGIDCAWLLAWHNARGSVRKVYAQVGRRNNILPVDWTRVATALEEGGATIQVIDPTTGSRVTARIAGTSAGNSALVANFS